MIRFVLPIFQKGDPVVRAPVFESRLIGSTVTRGPGNVPVMFRLCFRFTHVFL